MGYIIVYLIGLFVNFRKERQEAIDQEVQFPLKKFLLTWVISDILLLAIYLLIDHHYYKKFDFTMNDKEITSINPGYHPYSTI